MEKINVKLLNTNSTLPTRGHHNDAGLDLYSAEDVIIQPGETKVVSTGVAVELPEGYEATVRPRSGLTSKTKLRVQLGTVDEGYRGDIGIIIDNSKNIPWLHVVDLKEDGTPIYTHPVVIDDGLSKRATYKALNVKNELEEVSEPVVKGSYIIKKGDKIAQLVISKVEYPATELVYDFDDETTRGDNGYGSSGY